MTIWKYVLKLTDEQFISVPFDAQFLSVQMCRGELCLWARVNPKYTKVNYLVYIFGTGNPANLLYESDYIGTVQIFESELVFHVFVTVHPQ